MNARDIIVRPIITEKTTKMSQNGNWIVFEVSKKANKVSIAQAVKEIYGIKPLAVNVSNTKSKLRRVGRYSGMTKSIKKAMVKLPDGQTIDVFNQD